VSITGTAGVPPAASVNERTRAGGTPTVPVRKFLLPVYLHTQLAAEAREAFPCECCGLIEGMRSGDAIEVFRLHPARNLSPEGDRFEIDPAEHIRLLRNLRGTARRIIGCYHSHPNGTAAPSARDLASASEENFVWLIAGVRADGTSEIAAHLFASGAFRLLRIA